MKGSARILFTGLPAFSINAQEIIYLYPGCIPGKKMGKLQKVPDEKYTVLQAAAQLHVYTSPEWKKGKTITSEYNLIYHAGRIAGSIELVLLISLIAKK